MRFIQDKIDSVTLHRPWLEHITHDLYGIAERIREIDDGYFIVRNRMTSKYEVHNADTMGATSYEFTVPFDFLDKRTLDFCKETRAENTEKIIRELEENERKREEEYRKSVHNMNESRAIELANDLRRAI